MVPRSRSREHGGKLHPLVGMVLSRLWAATCLLVVPVLSIVVPVHTVPSLPVLLLYDWAWDLVLVQDMDVEDGIEDGHKHTW